MKSLIRRLLGTVASTETPAQIESDPRVEELAQRLYQTDLGTGAFEAVDSPGDTPDREIVRVITKPENHGDLDFGPVVVMHQRTRGDVVDSVVYAHVFGPFATIREAIADAQASTQHGDLCYKVVMPYLTSMPVTLDELTDAIEEQLGNLGFEVDHSADDEPLVKLPLLN